MPFQVVDRRGTLLPARASDLAMVLRDEQGADQPRAAGGGKGDDVRQGHARVFHGLLADEAHHLDVVPEATSGTTPPKARWISIWEATSLLNTSPAVVTTEAAVSSQEVSGTGKDAGQGGTRHERVRGIKRQDASRLGRGGGRGGRRGSRCWEPASRTV